MTDEELIKKKSRPSRISEVDSVVKPKTTFPTLARIVLSNGSKVDIPKLPMSSSQLTTYDHLRIAMEHGALAISCLNRIGSHPTPRLADSHNMAPIRLNLEDLLNHLYYAIEGFYPPKDAA